MREDFVDHRLVFKGSGEARLAAVCLDNFWMLQAQRVGDPARQIPTELVFVSDEDDIQIYYVDDPIAECTYVVVDGADKSKAYELIKDGTDTWDEEEVLSEWRLASHDSAQVSAILLVGVAAPHAYDERFAQVLKEGLAQSDRAVREAAIAALAYREWPEFDPILERIAEHDGDQRCRNRAALMLEVRQQVRARLESS